MPVMSFFFLGGGTNDTQDAIHIIKRKAIYIIIEMHALAKSYNVIIMEPYIEYISIKTLWWCDLGIQDIIIEKILPTILSSH